MNLRNCLLFLFFFSLSYAQAQTKPVNDECSGAINVVVEAPSATYNVAGATLSMPACSDSVVYNDTWYKFTATATHLRVLANYLGLVYPPVIQVFSGTCGNLTALTCTEYADNGVDLINLTKGATYYYRVCQTTADKPSINVQTEIDTLQPPPSNDEATGATPLNTDSTYSLNENFPTPSMPPCTKTQYPANDVWYSFVAKTADNTVSFTPNTQYTYSNADYVFQVFSGTPGNLTSLGYVLDPYYYEEMQLNFPTLTPGQRYYIRVYDNNGGEGYFYEYNLRIASNFPPINDECNGAINVNTTGTVVTGTVAGATLSMPACTGTAYSDVWFYFTATSTRHQIFARVNCLPPVATVIQVFKGSCGSLTSLSCSDYTDGVADLSGLTPGETYYYRVYPNGLQNPQAGVTTHIVTPSGTPPNDEVTEATLIYPDDQYTGLSLGWATQSMPACETLYNNQAEDVWYKFVATTTSHYIAFTEYNEPLYYYNFQVFSGTPTSLNSLACVSTVQGSSEDTATIKGLTVGQTYYIRVYDFISVASPSNQYDLKISSVYPAGSASTPKTAVSENSIYTIYPNPAHSLLYVQKTGSMTTPAYTISDVTGRLYLSGRLTSNQINIGQLPRGSFVLTIRDGATPTSILFSKE